MRCVAEYEDGVLSPSYTHEPGLYGNLLSQNRNGVTSYYHYNGRGDTVALTDDAGNVPRFISADAGSGRLVKPRCVTFVKEAVHTCFA